MSNFNFNKKSGFTLIELIIVITVLGILAAYAVPKLFDMTDTAQNASLDQIKIEVDSALRLYGLDQLAKGNGNTYPSPTADLLDSATPDNSILDDYENAKLDYDATNATAAGGYFTYNIDGIGILDANDYYMLYDTTGTTKYNLGDWTQGTHP